MCTTHPSAGLLDGLPDGEEEQRVESCTVQLSTWINQLQSQKAHNQQVMARRG